MLCSNDVIHDDFGPEKIVNVYDPKTGMEGVLVIDNTARGPGKGGIRMVPDLSVSEVARLARAMTLKNSLADLPFGGAKSGIKRVGNESKEELIRAFAKKIKALVPMEYIAAPDINTGEYEMAAFADEIGHVNACTGKPTELGGLPHELGSTGYGVAQSALVAFEFAGKDADELTIALEGFGNVGVFTARFLSEAGCKIVAVSDSKGAIYNEKGLDVAKLEKTKREKGTVTAYKDGKVLGTEKLFELKADVLIPGARPDVINDSNKAKIRAGIIVEAANIPIQTRVEEELENKGILIVPDFVANAGGVISSYLETINGRQSEAFPLIKEKVGQNTKLVLETARTNKTTARKAAETIAFERVAKAMEYRGWNKRK